ncbi:2-C-methyl-D-erythritol 4-phosphate cytidylyltransferase [Aquisalimonas asiatica]|uniref:2-C-methyl-D-erythritol 4-phosphate cytidylyltransferase n=1 Tax=Aquisalimonas asiatica TaxID=406100 RepID=A0A1H8QIY5_9GAMM|nr:2-C-methyl-D-erythritol 4-phosphate cytidylyltransferase [Aquisalimonas asiatica]SEO53961.1 2-C-methyl-D-erythritol 4-phosphate cytidylyltransferase [Aquisalimonas asiatica]
MTDPAAPRVWAVVPAAGVGRRMAAPVPKQYLPLLEHPVMDWSLHALLMEPRVAGAVVALGDDDNWWRGREALAGKALYRVRGGRERADSVLACLRFLVAELAGHDDWVLVHDAVRPCLTPSALARLLDLGLGHADGALLAVPVRDTLKQGGRDGTVRHTTPRDALWQAQTPQLFPLGALLNALRDAHDQGVLVTDEAQAMEHAGYAPLLVEGDSTNLKITRPGDLPLAESILRARGGSRAPEE